MRTVGDGDNFLSPCSSLLLTASVKFELVTITITYKSCTQKNIMQMQLQQTCRAGKESQAIIDDN